MFDRFDIVEAYYVWLADHHCGVVHADSSKYWCSYNRLSLIPSKLKFKPRPNLSKETLTENGREIYDALCRRDGTCDCLKEDVRHA